MLYQRARSEEQKNERINNIVKTTATLYATTPYHTITLSMVAKELSFTRANLYKYFRTKEEIFLEIILTDLRAWSEDVTMSFEKTHSLNLGEFAHIWSVTLARHPRLLELLGLINTIIEQNVTVEKLIPYKKQFFSFYGSVIEVATSVLKDLSPEECKSAVHRFALYAIGLYPTTKLNPVQEEAIASSGIPYATPDFITDLESMISVYLQGVIHNRSDGE
jgi:AcrR family transcriptional regulator